MLLENPATAWRASATHAFKSSAIAFAARGVRPERAGAALHWCGARGASFLSDVAVMPEDQLPATKTITTCVLHSFKALKSLSLMRLVQEYASKSRLKDA